MARAALTSSSLALCECGTRGVFAFAVRELVKVNGHFEFVDSVEQVGEYCAHMFGAFFEGLLAVENFAGNSCARFGGLA